MSSNQPAQQTAATRFLIHTLLSFGVGILFAVLTAIGNYIYTAGNAIDIKVVATVAGAALVAYFFSHFTKDIQPNEAQLLQGINDVVNQAIQNAHAPLYNAVGQLQQQVAQTAVQVAQPRPAPEGGQARTPGVTAQPAPQPQPLPISQQSTLVTPAVAPVPNYPTAQVPAVDPASFPTLTFDIPQPGGLTA